MRLLSNLFQNFTRSKHHPHDNRYVLLILCALEFCCFLDLMQRMGGRMSIILVMGVCSVLGVWRGTQPPSSSQTFHRAIVGITYGVMSQWEITMSSLVEISSFEK